MASWDGFPVPDDVPVDVGLGFFVGSEEFFSLAVLVGVGELGEVALSEPFFWMIR